MREQELWEEKPNPKASGRREKQTRRGGKGVI